MNSNAKSSAWCLGVPIDERRYETMRSCRSAFDDSRSAGSGCMERVLGTFSGGSTSFCDCPISDSANDAKSSHKDWCESSVWGFIRASAHGRYGGSMLFEVSMQ